MIKKCVVCGAEFEGMTSSKICSDGCRKENGRKYYREYYQRNKETCKQYQRKYCQRNREKINQRQRKHRQRNREETNQKQREYIQRNRGVIVIVGLKF
jgi:hypothetical protein